MPSFELLYEESDDILEVTFANYDEDFARALPLNDHIVLHTDNFLSAAWGLTFYAYAQLLQVSETHLDELRNLEERDTQRLLALLARPPISHFLEVLDANDLRALVKAPSVQALVGGGR